MDIKLFNTLNKSKEVFKPITPGKLGMYNCGPTVYDRVHVGNLRSYVFADVIRRTFEYFGYEVRQIINITDVGHLSGDGDEGEDKMSKALKRDGLSPSMEAMRQVGEKYAQHFVEDLKSMNIELPEELPRASDHIAGNIEIIQILQDKGYTYRTSDGVYFDTSKFAEYGKLGNIDIASLRAGARVEINTQKKSPTDFALWKFTDNKTLGWESPFGRGFPGWHIECSTMSRQYLGQPFDIHTGGIDHIPTHHNNEIAQSEAAFGVPLANYWMHNEFVTIQEQKMAKSAGNFITLQTLKEQTVAPLSYRYWLLTAHYRSPVSFSYEALDAAQKAVFRLMSIISDIQDIGIVNQDYKQKFESFIADDLDTPKAIALMWDLVKDSSIKPEDKKATVLDFDQVLGLNMNSLRSVTEEAIPEEIHALAEAREVARKNRDWKQADALRNEIEGRGYEVRDTADGFKLRSK